MTKKPATLLLSAPPGLRAWFTTEDGPLSKPAVALALVARETSKDTFEDEVVTLYVGEGGVHVAEDSANFVGCTTLDTNPGGGMYPPAWFAPAAKEDPPPPPPQNQTTPSRRFSPSLDKRLQRLRDRVTERASMDGGISLSARVALPLIDAVLAADALDRATRSPGFVHEAQALTNALDVLDQILSSREFSS